MTRIEKMLEKIFEKIEQIQATAVTELPNVSAADVGKTILVTASGEWDKADIPDQLPTVSYTDVGKCVMVTASGEWTAALPLPAVTSSDEGKVLTVNSSGQWVAASLPS